MYEMVPLGGGVSVRAGAVGGGVSVQAGAFKGRGQCMSWCLWGGGASLNDRMEEWGLAAGGRANLEGGAVKVGGRMRWTMQKGSLRDMIFKVLCKRDH